MWRSLCRSGTMAVRLARVEGTHPRTNDIVYCPPTTHPQPKRSTVVFFPGDVQNYPELMENHPENTLYVKWNLIDTALLLSSFHKGSHIIVIKPARVESNVYSCFDNFLECDKFGTPITHSCDKAVSHLESLLNNIALLLNSDKCQFKHFEWSPYTTDLILMGFSKGCIVLNQLMWEICNGVPNDFLKDRIISVHWLDGGHGGKKGAWINQDNILQSLASLPWSFKVDVTPYQVERREWVRREENIFTNTLLNYGANIQRRLHFGSFPPSLLNHFRLLDAVFSNL